ncbi:MAG: DUF4876 domain-containing protein [Bacteroidales bacterium]|nr:DUF4876 domain-containing protein [Bacteroidales bacterium]MBR0030035.1 DUF4876 domain-containing protein [Bacteroidales bacterium]MBR0083766.1 DUF4876 domain-containing protein [Bacteroidales bacterium]
MKKTLLAALLAAALCACDKTPAVVMASWRVEIDESGLGQAPSPGSYKLTVTNIGTEEVNEYTVSGTISETISILPGVYNLTAQAHGSFGGRAYNYIGSLQGVTIAKDAKEEQVTQVKVAASGSSALVFKEIHYNGSMVSGSASGRYLKDTFFEVYNNSEETVYADGICLGDVLGYKVYDFSDKLPNASDYVFIGTYVWQIPGSGKDYPIAPGESFVIAASAIDHSKTAETVDLSTAEFETICDKYKEKGGQPDANAVNMALVCTIKESGLGNQLGRFTDAAWALFYPSVPLRKDGEYLESNHANNYGLEVLKSDILDAVDLLKSENPDDKRLEPVLDAGWIKCATTGGNQSIVRKVSGTREDGTPLLQDTNNTTEDFTISDKPQIRRDGVKRPSWSTWTTAQ